jgi:YHS domain-containing protein
LNVVAWVVAALVATVVPSPATASPASASARREPLAERPAPPPLAEPALVMSLDPLYPRVKYPDGLASLNDRCIVRQNRLNPAIHPVYVNGLPVAFCCTGCPGVFSNDPDPWLVKQKLRVQCAVERARPAKFTPATRLFVGHDVFYFSSAVAKAKFERAPLTYCGKLTDPVTRERFAPGALSPHVVRDGRAYYFRGPGTLARFTSHPDSFAVRIGA